jgi:hypothetical protein
VPELGEVVLVAVGDLVDQSVGAQALEEVCGAPGCEAGDVGAQVGGAKAGDLPLTAGEGEEQVIVGVEEEVKAAQGAAFGLGRRRGCRYRP